MATRYSGLTLSNLKPQWKQRRLEAWLPSRSCERKQDGPVRTILNGHESKHVFCTRQVHYA